MHLSMLKKWNNSFCRKTSTWPRPKIIEMLWKIEKKCANNYKCGLESCGMMKRFQICSQNFNRIAFDPPFGWKKLRKTSEIGNIASFQSFFFLPKGGQMLSDLNSETRLGILSSFRIFLAPMCNDLHILIFRLLITYHFKKYFWRGEIGVFRQNELSHVIQHGKAHGNHRGNLLKMEKLEKWNTILGASVPSSEWRTLPLWNHLLSLLPLAPSLTAVNALFRWI